MPSYKADEEPRYRGRCVENLGRNVSDWCEKTGEGSSTADVCEGHAEQLDRDPHRFDEYLKPKHKGDPMGADGWGGDVVHPNYDDIEIRCAIPHCRVLLGGW